MIGLGSDKNNWKENDCVTFLQLVCLSLTDSLTDWLTDSLLFSELDWCDPGMRRCLLKACWGCYCCWSLIVMRIVLATVCCRFGNLGLVIKLNFCSDFEHFWFWSWSSGKILKLKFGQYFAAEVWLRLRSLILVNILKLGLVNILT